MTPEQWQKVKSLLEKAVELAPASRPAFLEKIADKDLRREVESLIEFEDADEDLLEDSAFSTLFGDDSQLPAGTQIGKYKIIGEIGSGGMGAVFLAERTDVDFDQKVAIKIIRRGINSEAVRRRFVRERRILASLEHSGIARLVDGGTTDDALPYLVMEYVEGTPINDFANEKNLNLEECLDIFREVCAAVSFAHQKLIIHRDLKPSNILITKDGKAKWLDFGIAKIIKSEVGGETRTQHFAFTPEYASPEQIRGENLSTSTDIYSLGIILYELLTGLRPFQFDNKNIGEIIETVTRNEPALPSFAVEREKGRKGEREIIPNAKISLSPFLLFSPSQIKGDLDNIILKSLKKEPERRYQSVEQFSEDIRRHLKGLPVFARQDTWRYRAEKFTQRNSLLVGTVALAFLILIAGILATFYQARKANIEREKAERRFNDVRALANSFMFEINEEMIKSPIKARELLVQRALEYLDKLAAESEGNTELKSELAAAYEKIGEVQSEIFRPFAGKTSEALLSQQKALKLREEVFAAEPSAARGVDVGISRINIGNVFLTSGKIGEARENYREAISILDRNIPSDSTNIEWRRRFAQSFALLGQTIVRSGSLSEALENYEKSLKMYQNLAAENPEIIRFQRSIGIVLSYIGFVKMEMGKTEEAAEYYGNWLEIQKKVIEKDANNIQFRNDLSTAHIWFGVILSEQQKIPQAQTHFNEGIKIQTEIFAADKENLGEEFTLADGYLEFGKAMVRNNLPDESIKNLETAIKHYRRVWQKDTKNLMNRHRIANAQRFLADAFFQKNDLAKASENYEQAHTVFIELTKSDPENIDWQQDLAMSFMRRGEFALKKNDKDSALENFRAALPIFEKLATNSPENIKRQKDLENIRILLAKVY